MAITAQYGILPAKVRYNTLLKPIEKLLYCELTAMTGYQGFLLVDMEHLCSFTGCSESTVRQYLGNLEKCGFIKSYPLHDGRTKIYLREGK